MQWMQQIERFFDALFGMLGNIIVAFVRRLAPFAVPAAPAYFFGHAVAGAVTERLAVAIGVVAAVGLESAGILAAHYAVRFYAEGERGRAKVATAAAGAYLLIGIAAIWGLEHATFDAKLTGTAMFLVAGLVYLLLGLDGDVQRRQQAGETARAHRLRLRRAEMEHEQKLAQIRAEAGGPGARAEAGRSTGEGEEWPGDYRLLDRAQKEQIAALTTRELVDLSGISPSTARRWRRKVELNGSGK